MLPHAENPSSLFAKKGQELAYGQAALERALIQYAVININNIWTEQMVFVDLLPRKRTTQFQVIDAYVSTQKAVVRTSYLNFWVSCMMVLCTAT